ncbi:lipase [Kibdelosporangium banguiense]|uniref:Lipase n=1 Tax=Kibdelosporangium banguiense TaxID=1365924 RepID=A0ABS4TNU9_9PSEU|nr:alpha/beta hydrolase [Kibdelosporangium banguiense]MBP2325640.1 lipase [Kibdelosporangium banguiense]
MITAVHALICEDADVSIPLHVQEFGEGRPLLALHGLSGHGGRWRRFAASQLDGFRVIAPDLRGHGASVAYPPWNLEQFVADVLGVMDGLGLERVPVMGHSYGGAISVHLAAAAPERVERLVLVDPALGLDPVEGLQDAEEARQDKFFDDLAAARASQLDRWPFASDEQLQDELDTNFVQGEDGRWRRNYVAAMAVTAWSEMSRPLLIPPRTVPTLLLPALQADFVSPSMVEAYRAVLGDNLTVREIDCGHSIHLERPEEMGKVVNAFLQGATT